MTTMSKFPRWPWVIATSLACGGAAGTGGEPASHDSHQPPASEAPPRTTSPGGPTSSDTRSIEPGPPVIACTDQAVPGLLVTVDNSSVDCDELSVIATDSGYAETLLCFGPGSTCQCPGASERPGTYELSVSTGDPPVELQHSGPIQVPRDQCHVITRAVTLHLSPALEDAGPSAAHDAGVADGGP
jgi:hypothetical protein